MNTKSTDETIEEINQIIKERSERIEYHIKLCARFLIVVAIILAVILLKNPS